MNSNREIQLLSTMVRGAYDLQMLRMQAGIRLVGNFRAKLKDQPSPQRDPSAPSEPPSPSSPKDLSEPHASRDPATASEPASPSPPDQESELSPEAESIIEKLRKSYRLLTQGVAKNRTIPTEKGFTGDAIISEFTELVLVDQYMAIEREEAKQFRLLTKQLERIPIYNTYLSKTIGVGPAMAGVLIAWLDPHKARHRSSFWKFAGLDTGPDGKGRSRRAEHLILREYTDKNGDTKTRNSITYDPFLKTKLMGVLASSFIRLGSPWRRVYDDYKHRLLTDQNREKVTLQEWKSRRKAGEDVSNLWPPGRIDNASKRYMVKIFLAELWEKWRALEGLDITPPYPQVYQNRKPHKAA